MTAAQTNPVLAQTAPAPRSTLQTADLMLKAQEATDKVLPQTARTNKARGCTMLAGTRTKLATSISQCTTLLRPRRLNLMVRLRLTLVIETILTLALVSIQLALLQ